MEDNSEIIQSNFNGSNTLGTMKISSETGVVLANEGLIIAPGQKA